MQNAEKLRRLRIPAMLLAALAVGAALGICFEQNVGVSLSDRLARRIGTANAQVVSCARSGSAMTLTLDLGNAPQEQESASAASFPAFQQGMDLANYRTVIGAVQEELTSNPLERGVERVTVVCRYQGKTAVTLTGDRAPKNVGARDGSGKTVSPEPFSSFEACYADGSTAGISLMESDSSASAP